MSDKVDPIFGRATVVAVTENMPRPLWLGLRRHGLGGSDAAAVLGISPWTSPYGLWLDKTGQLPADDDDTGSLRLRAGAYLEGFVVTEAEAHLPGLVVAPHPVMLADPDHPMLLADLDGIAHLTNATEPGIFEAKTVSPHARHGWADGVPTYYTAQVAHYLAVTGAPYAVVAALFGLDAIETFIIDRDDELIDMIVDAEVAWWQRHVIDGEPPPVDGSRAATAALQLLEARAGAVCHVPEPDLAERFAVIAEAKDELDRWTDVDRRARNEIRADMADATELVDHDGVLWATWRRGKDRTDTDWQAVATEIARAAFGLDDAGAFLDAVSTKHTTTTPGTRTLRVAAGLRNIEDNN